MKLLSKNNISKIFMPSALFIILGILLWNTSLFFKRLEEVERENVKIWAQSQKSLASEKNSDYLTLNFLIATSKNNIPIVGLDTDGEVTVFNHIPENITSNEKVFKEYIENLKTQNKPIYFAPEGIKPQFLYYGTSPVLKKLKYYPLAIITVVLLFVGMVYFFFHTSKISEQNKLWAGMAKETAHQIGTPLSALVGWVEILKTENVDPDYISEIEKDIVRLKMITERFSKIGSKPSLKKLDIITETKEAFAYLKARSSKLIQFSIDTPENEILVHLNSQLYGWTIENLVKNAIDAMRGRGNLKIKVLENKHFVQIQVIDTGQGIPRRNYRKVFNPGFTSKSAGWGLGLSLAKRIVVDYHDGKIKVAHSEKGKGTTFQISLRKS